MNHLINYQQEVAKTKEQLQEEMNELKKYIKELEVGIIKWAGRPTKDGAKNLRSLVRNYSEARDEANKKGKV